VLYSVVLFERVKDDDDDDDDDDDNGAEYVEAGGGECGDCCHYWRWKD